MTSPYRGVTGGPNFPANSFKPGDTVAALWSDGGYYLGRVTAVKGGQFEVLYDDGEQAVVSAGELVRTAAATESIAVGTRVLAAWKGARMFTGEVMAAAERTVTVRWDDGDAPLVVAKDRVAVLATPGDKPVVAASAGLVAGARVAAMWSDGSFWGATIERIEGNGFAVVCDDGERDVRGAGELRLITREEIPIGTPVLACWRGAARMYPGTVTAKRGNLYTVKWDDGDTPTDESREKIVVLRAQ